MSTHKKNSGSKTLLCHPGRPLHRADRGPAGRRPALVPLSPLGHSRGPSACVGASAAITSSRGGITDSQVRRDLSDGSSRRSLRVWAPRALRRRWAATRFLTTPRGRYGWVTIGGKFATGCREWTNCASRRQSAASHLASRSYRGRLRRETWLPFPAHPR